jgi:hypothetical protein
MFPQPPENKGVSDIAGITEGGRAFYLEVKCRGKLTLEQGTFLANVRDSGGIGEVVRTFNDVVKILDLQVMVL